MAAETIDGSPAERDADVVLDVSHLTTGYGDVQVVDDFNAVVREGEIVTLIGPNGAGKSTVIKSVFGFVKPWSGTVSFHGQDIAGEEPEDIVRKGISWIPQRQNTFKSMSVRENLEMGGFTRDGGIGDRIEEIYDIFPALERHDGANAAALSGGQRQMLAMGRALMLDPELLLVDEPSAGLAPELVDTAFDNIEKVRDRGTAVLMVEQNATKALQRSDRGYVLDQGQDRFEGTADELLDNDEVAQLYLGAT
ncbi:ABC transporter ATP-binding protein [Haloplanus litoreus]|uniref:ABC transporter ATP-binding protein n=1 Tax=Haloplanus litoreus TaxID=767515 RepID=A0ABD5ZWQ2_9EURY